MNDMGMKANFDTGEFPPVKPYMRDLRSTLLRELYLQGVPELVLERMANAPFRRTETSESHDSL